MYSENTVGGRERGVGKGPHWSLLTADFCAHILYSGGRLQILKFDELSNASHKSAELAVLTGGESHHCGFKSYRVVGLCCARLLAASTEQKGMVWPEPRVTIRNQHGTQCEVGFASLVLGL